MKSPSLKEAEKSAPKKLKPKSRLIALCFALREASRQSVNDPHWRITVAGGIASIRVITSVVPCDSIFWDEGEYAKYQGTFGEEIHISAEGGFLWCAYGWERQGDL